MRKIASSRIDELTLDNTALRYEELDQLAELFPNLAILLLRSPLKGNRSLGLSGLSNLTKLHQLTPRSKTSPMPICRRRRSNGWS